MASPKASPRRTEVLAGTINPAATLAARHLPPLPPLPCPLDYRGPSPWSNWVIKGRILAGAYPASPDDFETDALLTKILELGVNTFVCLQAEFSLAAPEAAWRSGQALRPYVKDAQRLLIQARHVKSKKITQSRLDLLHLPIIDGSITSDHALSRLADDCAQRVLDGEMLYVHCWGGHGRTGTLIAVLLARLYGLSAAEALAYTQATHDVRKCPQNVRSPQTQVQVDQVRRILGAERQGEKALGYRWPQQRPLVAETAALAAAVTTRPASVVEKSTKSPIAIAMGPGLQGPLGVLNKESTAAGMNPPVRSGSLIPAVGGSPQLNSQDGAGVARKASSGSVVNITARAGQPPHPLDVWDPR